MNVTDEDMQMVRDFLAQANAPFHIAEHFENLVAEHAKEADRVEELKLEVDELTGKVDDLKECEEERDRLQEDLDDRDRDELRALETVKYWLHDVIVLGGPMRRRPREILKIVERTIG